MSMQTLEATEITACDEAAVIEYGAKLLIGSWEVGLVDYALFVKKNGRFPRSNATNREEDLLAIWMGNQKTFLRTGQLPEERILLLNLFVPSWQIRYRKRPQWEEAFEDAKRFVASHGRFPRQTSKSPEEKFLGNWLGLQREPRTAQRDSNHAERITLLDRDLPGWRDSYRRGQFETWNENLSGVKEHVIMHARLPINSNSLPDERKIAQWMSQQIAHFKKGRLSQERINRLDQEVPLWRTFATVDRRRR